MVYAKTKDKEEWKKHVTSMCCVIIASLIMSVNIKSFVREGNLIPGGFTGISLNSFLVDLIPVAPITYDPLLVSVFGGILNGIAIVIALYGKASSGGTDFIAVYLSNKLK